MTRRSVPTGSLKDASSEGAASGRRLLSELLGQGIADRLTEVFGSLHSLARASDMRLRAAVPQIDEQDIRRLRAAFGLASALAGESLPRPYRISCTSDVVALLREELRLLDHECLFGVFVDAGGHVLSSTRIAEGSQSEVCANPKAIFDQARELEAAAFFLVHNHPSGETSPSPADLAFTAEASRLGQQLGIALVDHIIVGLPFNGPGRDFVSLKALGHVPDCI